MNQTRHPIKLTLTLIAMLLVAILPTTSFAQDAPDAELAPTEGASAPVSSETATSRQGSFSEPRQAFEGKHHAVGFTTGLTSGLGLSYRRIARSWFGQVSFMPVWTRASGGEVFGGAQVGKIVHQSQFYYLNVALGTGVMWSDRQDCSVILGTGECGRTTNTYLAAGPSVGVGLIASENFVFEAYLPIAAVIEVGQGLDAIWPFPGLTVGYTW